MVPLHHRTTLTESGEEYTAVPLPPPQSGGRRGRPHRKLRQKTAHRYYKHESLHAVLHGRGVIVCPSSNRGTHRRRWRNKTCARHSEYRGGRKEEGGGDVAGGYHHGTRTTGVSCRRRLLRMRAPIVVQDHVVWLPSGGPHLRVLSVSGVVCQCRAPDPAGQAADNAGGTRRRIGSAEGEEATGAGKMGGRKGASRGGREGLTRGDKPTFLGTTARPEATYATGYGGKGEGEGRR